jgi:gliding motility-associated-like protein
LKKFSLIVLFALFLVPGKIFSTHIVGGEIYYDYLGGNNYKITLKVYRDCFNGVPPFDNPGFVFVYDAFGNLTTTLSIAVPPSTIIPPTINNPCFTPPNDICVEEAVYITTATLPPSPGGYTLVYQRCCRNISILNIINPNSVGASYFCHIPGSEVVAVNSEPRFTYFPPIFICNGIPINFDHVASDPDGDSLAYKLCDPYNGLDDCCPSLNPPTANSPNGVNCPASCPINAPPPPYPTVPFLFPYTGAYPLSSNPAIAIDVNTGWLSGVPDLNGQWVVGVCVEEWRNGVLIGTHHRDFQFNVVACPGLVYSSILGQTTYCFGYTATFDNQSTNGTGYLWNFGDPTTLADTSHAFEPNYTYPDTGHYTVTLIVNPYTPCADTSSQTFEIFPLLDPVFTQPAGQCITGNNFSFTAGGTFAGNGIFSWTFGSVASPSSSSLQNPSGITYSQPGTFPVGLTISENGCTESFVDSVVVFPIPDADFNATPLLGCVPMFVQFYDSSVVGTPANYFWDFGDGTSSTLQNPSHVYPNIGVYTVSLTLITVSGCIDTSTIVIPAMVTVQGSPTAGFSLSPTSTSIFEPWITMTDASVGAVSWYYYYGDGGSDSIPNPIHTYSSTGEFDVMQVVINSVGCPDTAYQTVNIIPEYRFWIPNAFTPFNNDQVNPIFKPVVFGVEEYEFLIFDRWGELIYETHEPTEGWDGTYRGDKCQMEVYVWKVSYRDVIELRQYIHVGHVTLVR